MAETGRVQGYAFGQEADESTAAIPVMPVR
jgi:hypothetical protein